MHGRDFEFGQFMRKLAIYTYKRGNSCYTAQTINLNELSRVMNLPTLRREPSYLLVMNRPSNETSGHL